MSEFRFRHSWETAAAPREVYDVLVDVATYPTWWPQVRAVAYVDEHTGRVICRSLAPFDLDLLLRSEVEDPDHGILRVALAGDLEGWCAFTLSPTRTGTRLEFEQRVRVARPGLALAARLLGPLLRANHAWMMRGCRRGLAGRPGRAGRGTGRGAGERPGEGPEKSREAGPADDWAGG